MKSFFSLYLVGVMLVLGIMVTHPCNQTEDGKDFKLSSREASVLVLLSWVTVGAVVGDYIQTQYDVVEKQEENALHDVVEKQEENALLESNFSQ